MKRYIIFLFFLSPTLLLGQIHSTDKLFIFVKSYHPNASVNDIEYRQINTLGNNDTNPFNFSTAKATYEGLIFEVDRSEEVTISDSTGAIGRYTLPYTGGSAQPTHINITENGIFINCGVSINQYHFEPNAISKIKGRIGSEVRSYQLSPNSFIAPFNDREILVSDGYDFNAFNIENGAMRSILADIFKKPSYGYNSLKFEHIAYDKWSGILGVQLTDFDIYFFDALHPENNVKHSIINGKEMKYLDTYRLNRYAVKRFSIDREFSGITCYYPDGEIQWIYFSNTPSSTTQLISSEKRFPFKLVNDLDYDNQMPTYPGITETLKDSVKIDFFQFNDNQKYIDGKYYQYKDYIRDIRYGGFVLQCNNLLLNTYVVKGDILFNAIVIPETFKVICQYKSGLLRVYDLSKVVGPSYLKSTVNSAISSINLAIKQKMQNYNVAPDENTALIVDGKSLYKVEKNTNLKFSYSYDEDTLVFKNDFLQRPRRLLHNDENGLILSSGDKNFIINPGQNTLTEYDTYFNEISSGTLNLSTSNNKQPTQITGEISYSKCAACAGSGIRKKVYEPGVGYVGGGKCLVCGGTGRIRSDLVTKATKNTENGEWLIDSGHLMFSKTENAIFIPITRTVKVFNDLKSNDVRVTGNYLSDSKRELISSSVQKLYNKFSLTNHSGQIVNQIADEVKSLPKKNSSNIMTENYIKYVTKAF